MSCAEKGTWWIFSVSLVTVLIGAGASVFIRANQIDVFQDVVCRGYGVLATIPLIAILVLSWRFPGREYDERDRDIERKAQCLGLIGGMGFLCGLALLLRVLDPLGSISTGALPWLAYLTFFTCMLFQSGAGLVQYRCAGKGGCDG
jgi:ABC-type proline/glycine betaine transport system permease subunit